MYDDIAASRIRDVALLLDSKLVFNPSDVYYGWMLADSAQGTAYVRFGRTFPEESLWALWLGDGWFDFDDTPANWTIHMVTGTWENLRYQLAENLPTKAELIELLRR